MLRRLSDIKGFTIAAVDGDVGSLHDVYVEDETWTVRYLVADTGLWLGRLVAISPVAIDRPDWQGRRLPMHLTRTEIERAPDILDRGRLTRDVEAEFAAYYGYPFYWGGVDLWGWAGSPGALRSAPPAGYVPADAEREVLDAALESTSIYGGEEIIGYHIRATDGEIGHVDDIVIDDESWSVRYLQLDTSNWIGGRTVLLAARWVRLLDPADGTLQVDLPRQAIETSPEYDPAQPIDRGYEQRLHQHYGLPSYWEVVRTRGAGQP